VWRPYLTEVGVQPNRSGNETGFKLTAETYWKHGKMQKNSLPWSKQKRKTLRTNCFYVLSKVN